MPPYCGASSKFTDLIMSMGTVLLSWTSVTYLGSHLNLNLLSAELGSCLAVPPPHCHPPGVPCPSPKAVSSPPCSFLLLPGT